MFRSSLLPASERFERDIASVLPKIFSEAVCFHKNWGKIFSWTNYIPKTQKNNSNYLGPTGWCLYKLRHCYVENILESPFFRWISFFSKWKKPKYIVLFIVYRELVVWLRGDFLHEWIFTRDILLGHLSWQYDLLSLVSKSPALQKYTGVAFSHSHRFR